MITQTLTKVALVAAISTLVIAQAQAYRISTNAAGSKTVRYQISCKNGDKSEWSTHEWSHSEAAKFCENRGGRATDPKVGATPKGGATPKAIAPSKLKR